MNKLIIILAMCLFSMFLPKARAVAADRINLQGAEKFQLAPATTNFQNCKTSALVTIDYDNLKLYLKEEFLSGECVIDPNGETYEIHEINLSNNEDGDVGIKITIKGNLNTNSYGKFELYDTRALPNRNGRFSGIYVSREDTHQHFMGWSLSNK